NNIPLLDSHGHLIVKHDLFNHDGLTQDGIAEAFSEFAKKEHLPTSSFLMVQKKPYLIIRPFTCKKSDLG
ncbi:hypothetical protein, partial [Parabacteroides sp. ZJ-118]|uniref:hypothetical protein n=1 Tax=Parabacteroides sp. ZJ-118 TaxID=2709398 RepID=UPI00197F9BEF